MFLALMVACVDPATFGAVPDDNKPDNEALQKAIDEASAKQLEVCLGDGVWDIAPPVRVTKKGPIGSLIISTPVTIRGHGAKTIVRMTGDGNKHDWRGIHILGAHGVTLADFTIDGLGAFDTEEQTHLVEVGPDSQNVTVTGMTFGPMRKPDEKVGHGIGGDGIRLLGNPGHEVDGVVIADSKFIDCDRSGIGIQRAVRNVSIVRDNIVGAGDQSIDFEPTGRGAVENILIDSVMIGKPDQSQGSWAMTLVGTGRDLASHILVVDSVLDGGGIMMMNVDDVELRGDDIREGPQDGDPVVSIIRRATDVRIVDSTITRPGLSKPGAVVRASHNNGSVPHGLVIEQSHLRQDTPAVTVESESVGGVVVRDNELTYGGHDAMSAVRVAAVANDVSDVTVIDNTIKGNIDTLLDLASRNHAISDLHVHGNGGVSTTSVRCRGTAASYTKLELDSGATSSHACKGVAIDAYTAPKK